VSETLPLVPLECWEDRAEVTLYLAKSADLFVTLVNCGIKLKNFISRLSVDVILFGAVLLNASYATQSIR